jgi:putative sigma-54 modulation protein
MEITIKGRHWKPTATFKEYAVERIEKLTRYYPRLIRAQLVVTQEGYRHHAELHLHGSSMDLLAKAFGADPRAALEAVLGKQERALSRRKEKLDDRKKRSPTLRLEPAVAEAPQPKRPSQPEIAVVRQRPRPVVLSVEDAARTLLQGKKPVLVFTEPGEEGLRVAYRLGEGRVGLLELD